MAKKHQCDCGETDPSKFYKNQKGRCKLCAIEHVKNRYKNLSPESKAEYIAYNAKNYKKWTKDNIFQYRFLSARNRAYKKQIPIDITVEFLEKLFKDQNGKCFYSGLPMTVSDDKKYSISVDRLDSSKGYTRDNVVLAASIVNSMKNDLSIEEFKSIVKTLSDNLWV